MFPGDHYRSQKYEIRQEWRKGQHCWMETVFTTRSKLHAERMYSCYTHQEPEGRFELVHIDYREHCCTAQNTDHELYTD